MENLKLVKDRISTIDSIIKATNAMKMVSTVKLSRINNKNKYSKECADSFFTMVSKILADLAFDQVIGTDHWMIPKKDGRALYLIFSTNQGFCGSFNQSIIEESKKLVQDGGIIRIFGKKAASVSPKDLCKIEDNGDRLDIIKQSLYVADMVISHLRNDRISKIIVVSGHFRNVMSQKAQALQIFPFDIPKTPEYIKVDGSPILLLESLFVKYIEKLFNAIITEHVKSELSARVMAMDNSVRNATDMYNSLNVLYNRSRQAKITQELNEIVSSIECVQ